MGRQVSGLDPRRQREDLLHEPRRRRHSCPRRRKADATRGPLPRRARSRSQLQAVRRLLHHRQAEPADRTANGRPRRAGRSADPPRGALRSGRRATVPAGASGRMPARAASRCTPAAAAAAAGGRRPGAGAGRRLRCAAPPRTSRAAGARRLSAAPGRPGAGNPPPSRIRPRPAPRRRPPSRAPVPRRCGGRTGCSRGLLGAQARAAPIRSPWRGLPSSRASCSVRTLSSSPGADVPPPSSPVSRRWAAAPPRCGTGRPSGVRAAAGLPPARSSIQKSLPEPGPQLRARSRSSAPPGRPQASRRSAPSRAARWAWAWVSQRSGPPGPGSGR